MSEDDSVSSLEVFLADVEPAEHDALSAVGLRIHLFKSINDYNHGAFMALPGQIPDKTASNSKQDGCQHVTYNNATQPRYARRHSLDA